jgi:heme-degrading monooxygenase HmoA
VAAEVLAEYAHGRRPETRWRAGTGSGQGEPVTAEPAIAATPEPPYVAVIFTSLRTAGDHGYARMAARLDELAAQQPGHLGVESARDGVGITVSYWRDEESARAWKQVAEHQVAQQRGRDVWYSDYRVRVAVVTRDYGPAR